MLRCAEFGTRIGQKNRSWRIRVLLVGSNRKSHQQLTSYERALAINPHDEVVEGNKRTLLAKLNRA